MQSYKNVLLVDYENRSILDLSALDKSYKVIIFVGANQSSDKLRKSIARKNKESQVEYLKVRKAGKNSLDFYIAFNLGRLYETSKDTKSFIFSADHGFDALVSHINDLGMSCQRIDSLSELPTPVMRYGVVADNPEDTVCFRCKKMVTIEHNGGRWCTNCGRFATPPDVNITAKLIESKQAKPDIRESLIQCADCSLAMSVGDGIYDDGEWICYGCVGVDFDAE